VEDGINLTEKFKISLKLEKLCRFGCLAFDMYNTNLNTTYYKPCYLCKQPFKGDHFSTCCYRTQIDNIIEDISPTANIIKSIIWWHWHCKKNRQDNRFENFVKGKWIYFKKILRLDELKENIKEKRKRKAKEVHLEEHNMLPKPGQTYIYTDGSKTRERAGCAVIIIKGGESLIKTYNFLIADELRHWTEMIALTIAINMKRENNIPNCKIFSDSSSSIFIAKKDPEYWLGPLNIFSDVSLGPSGVLGNELADVGANGGSADKVTEKMNKWLAEFNLKVVLKSFRI